MDITIGQKNLQYSDLFNVVIYNKQKFLEICDKNIIYFKAYLNHSKK